MSIPESVNSSFGFEDGRESRLGRVWRGIAHTLAANGILYNRITGSFMSDADRADIVLLEEMDVRDVRSVLGVPDESDGIDMPDAV